MITSLQYILDNLRIEFIIFAIVLYLLVLWMLVPIWVYMDAKKKYADKNLPWIFAGLILPFNIPGLIFYIIIRPEDEINHIHTEEDHILNVPVVKFLNDKNDFVLSFDLKINGNIISAEHRPDLKLNINIDPNKENLVIEDVVTKVAPALQPQVNQPQVDNNIGVKKQRKGVREYFKDRMNTVKSFFVVDNIDSLDK